ncbi:MAG: mechanosensitive ion channel family protein [Candidatus Eisenbacteria bacterium]|uniref:Mechanosensitive ion channel family protein n=1 Tax=Eiseniibacteriota bacterium TaxID=2212470 RepID=A0A956LYB7_UNCEI|nr:mechanosensitive ion channel family protein [Candidatus Eisenbacteria bacterium]
MSDQQSQRPPISGPRGRGRAITWGRLGLCALFVALLLEAPGRPSVPGPRGSFGLFCSAAQAQLPIPATKTRADAPSAAADSSAGASATERKSVPEARLSARATMLTFLKSVNDAARGEQSRLDDAVACLDLSEIPKSVRAVKGREYAVQLKQIIDRTRYVEIEEISDDPHGSPYVFTDQIQGSVVIARTPSGDWQFTKQTVADIPSLVLALRDVERVEGVTGAPVELAPGLRLREAMPASLRVTHFLLEDWQWLALFVLVLLGIILDRVLVLVVLRGLQSGMSRRGVMIANAELQTALRPLGLLGMALVWKLGLRLLDLPPAPLAVLQVAIHVVLAATSIWAAFRLIDIASAFLEKRADRTASKLDDVLVPLLRRAAKVFVFLVGIVFVADSLSLNVTGLVAGLGLGGLAFALAAQDTVKNLFGSVTVLVDRPFQIGDWIKIGGHEGTVVEVGFRTTRIRTFYDSMVTLPNAQLIASTVDNMGARRYRRWSTKLSVTYGTEPETIEAFCEGIRELIRRHPYTRKDYFHVYVNEFGASSLDILLYVFHEAPDWTVELQERHRLFLDILRLAQRLGVEFAFPTQTLHLQRATPVEPEPDYPVSPEAVQAALREGRESGERIARTLHETSGPPRT